jgi:hypothetical protein
MRADARRCAVDGHDDFRGLSSTAIAVDGGMTNPTRFTLAILLFGLAPLAQAAPPDRCATLDEYGYPDACAPVGWRDAPYWNEDVCCDAQTCVESSSLGCSADKQLYSCQYAELDAIGNVNCLFPVPYYCDVYECPAPPISTEYQAPPQEVWACCEHGGPCYPWQLSTDGGCWGQILYCYNGSSNEDGTINCDDYEGA